VSRTRRWARPGVAARPPAHRVCASRGVGSTSDSRAFPVYPRDPHVMQADTRRCGDAHTACCVHMWCLIAWPLELDWVCVWRWAGGRRGGDWAVWHAVRGRGKLSASPGLSGMVRVSDVHHWTKSVGTIRPYNALSALTSCQCACAGLCTWACAGMRVCVRVHEPHHSLAATPHIE
jgi:hypothetical protein